MNYSVSADTGVKRIRHLLKFKLSGCHTRFHLYLWKTNILKLKVEVEIKQQITLSLLLLTIATNSHLLQVN